MVRRKGGDGGSSGNLSNEEKLRLCVFAQENPTMSQKELCAWAHLEFDLAKPPCQATVSNILKKRALLQSMKTEELGFKRRRVLKNPELDRALGNWVLYCLNKGLKVTGELIKKQAATFVSLLNHRNGVVENAPASGSTATDAASASSASDMAFSNGWLAGFQERHGIKNLRKAAPQQSAAAYHAHAHQQQSAPYEGVPIGAVSLYEHSLSDLQALTHSYHPRDVYHMDEFGLFYDMPLDQNQWTAQHANSSATKPPARLAIVAVVNADGSDRVEPFFIGKALRPKSFKDKLAVERGFSYDHNQKGWMNGLIFLRWMQAFDARMREENRSVVLVLDSATSHVVVGLELTNVRVAFLALKGSTKLQPLNGGIVKAFKRRYRRAHLVNALDRDEQGKANIFAVSQLEAMQWSKQCWMDLPVELIQNCWRHTRILGGEPLTAAEKRKSKLEDEIEDEIYKHIQWLRIANPMNLDDMLNPSGENDVHAGVAIEDFVSCAIEKEFEDDHTEDPATLNNDGTVLHHQQRSGGHDLAFLTNQEKLAHLSFSITILNEHGGLESTKQELRALQRAIRDLIVEQRRLSRR